MSDAPASPMSVLLLNPIERGGWGGVEKWMLLVAGRLIAHGHAVASAAKADSRWADACRDAGLPTTALGMRGDLHPRDLLALRRLYRERSIDLVIVKMPKCIRMAWAARLISPGRGPAILCRMGDAVMKRSLRSKLTYRHMVDRYITPAEFCRTALLDVGYFDADRIVAVPNGVSAPPDDPDARARVRAELGLGDAPVLAVTSRLHPAKGHAHLLDAMAVVRERFPAVRLVVAGDGVQRGDLEGQAHALGLGGGVVFAGFRTDVPALLRAADVFVLPSLLEGMPNTALEAMSVGLPVVATRVDGVPEAVADGETGLLVAPADAGALADALSTLLAEPERRAAMGEAGRRRAESEFSVDRMLDATEALCVETRDLRRL